MADFIAELVEKTNVTLYGIVREKLTAIGECQAKRDYRQAVRVILDDAENVNKLSVDVMMWLGGAEAVLGQLKQMNELTLNKMGITQEEMRMDDMGLDSVNIQKEFEVSK